MLMQEVESKYSLEQSYDGRNEGTTLSVETDLSSEFKEKMNSLTFVGSCCVNSLVHKAM